MSPFRGTLTLIAIALIIAAPAEAQRHDGTVGYGGGMIWFGDFNGGSAGESFALDPGWVATGHVEQWMGSKRLGARLSTAFTRRPMVTVDDTRQINTWLIAGDLLLRLLPARRGGSVAPFISGGVGVVSYGLGRGEEVVLVPEDARYPGDDERRLSYNAGLGIDIIPGLRLFGTDMGFRLEATDQLVSESPFTSVGGTTLDPIHNVRVSLSLIGLVDFLK